MQIRRHTDDAQAPYRLAGEVKAASSTVDSVECESNGPTRRQGNR